ncbi:phage tail protein [Aquimarina agarivorans]|uniref:phage tail protein n=1 Tax=Aquimarina agarivorans TaxID=980584 RepID=UPI000248EFEB|nr:phage tail protein [Aquimarina agarivorans]
MYQIVGFHFKVVFEDIGGKNEDIEFQSVTGLDVQIEKETYKEGGENRFEHSLPGRRKYSPLVLKRGIVKPNESALTEWCGKAFYNLYNNKANEQNIVPLSTVNIQLLNENHEVLMKWVLSHVWPISWKVSELNAEKSEVLIETFELNYNRFKLEVS